VSAREGATRWVGAGRPDGASASGHDLRLVPAALLAWAVAAWAVAVPVRSLAVAAAVCGLVALGALVVAVRAGALRAGAVRAGAVRAGALRAGESAGATGSAGAAAAVVLAAAASLAVLGGQSVDAVRRDAQPVRGWAAQGAVAAIAAVATQDALAVRPGRFPGRPRYLVRVSARSVEARGRRAAVHVPLLVLGGASWSSVTAGSRLRFTGRLATSEPADGTAAVVDAVGAPQVEAGGWVWRAADRVRAGLRRACAPLDPDSRGLLPALVVGDTANLPPPLVDDLRASGLTHLTAVSGANVAIVAGATVWAASAAGAGRTGRVWLALGAVVGFVVLARPQPSVLRAAVMGAVALLGLLRARRPRGVPVLAAAVVILLVVAPGLSRSPGFALSVTATAALVLLAPVWAARLERRVPRPVALAVAVPAAAQAACAPIVVLLSPSVSTTAVPANLLVAPAVAPATVLGVLAAVVSPVWPAAAQALAWCGGLAAGWIATVAHTAAAVPGSTLPWPGGWGGAALLAGLTAFVVALTLRDPSAVGPGGRDERGSGSAGAVLVAAAVLVALAVGWLAGPRAWDLLRGRGGAGAEGWAVAMCDVGQGDMLVLRSGPASAVVVDVGPDASAADRCLRRLGVRRLDLVVLTHFHADHVLGLPGALRGRAAGPLLVSRLPQPAGNAAAVLRWAAEAGAVPTEGRAGQAGEVGTGAWRVGWRVLAAEPQVARTPDAGPPIARSGSRGGSDAEGSEVNESSLVTEAVVSGPGGAVRVLGLGDLEAAGQSALTAGLRSGAVTLGGPVDVVKVAHHGSATQDPELYRLVGAPVALVGVGADNDYGHPADRTLSLLAAAGSRTARTDVLGTVTVAPERFGLEIISAAPP